MLYFAYGSNLHQEQMKKRCSSRPEIETTESELRFSPSDACREPINVQTS